MKKHKRIRGEITRETVRNKEEGRLEEIFLEGFKKGVSGQPMKEFEEDSDLIEKETWIKGYNKGKEQL